jgi:hypothetical protein
MLYVLLHIWPWALGALALGAFTGIFAGRLTAQPAQPKRPEFKKVVKEPKIVKEPAPLAAAVAPAATPDQIQALEKQLADRDAALADLRAGLDREVALRRAAIARLEGMMAEQQAQAPTRPIKGNKGSAKSSPSR